MKKKILILLLIFGFILGLQYYLNKTSTLTTQLPSGTSFNQVFPDIELVPINTPPFKLSDKKGVLYLINLWATWCGPCQYEIPHLNEIDREYHDKGVVVIGISLDDSDIPVKTFIKQHNISFPISMFNHNFPDFLRQLPGVPATLTLDSSLTIIDVVIGYQHKNYFEIYVARDET